MSPNRSVKDKSQESQESCQGRIWLFKLMPGPISHLSAVKAGERECLRPRVQHPDRLQRPLPESASLSDRGNRYSLAERVQALTLLSLGY